MSDEKANAGASGAGGKVISVSADAVDLGPPGRAIFEARILFVG